MDFSTFTGLKASIAEFINRDELNTGGQIAGFVALAEAQLARRLRRSTATATLDFTPGASAAELPADVAELRGMTFGAGGAYPNGGLPLTQVSMQTLDERRARGSQSGVPRAFAVFNGVVYVTPAPAAPYLSFTITYYSKLVPLSVGNPSNAVLAEAPDAYLYGACLEAAPFLEHDERIPVWQNRFDQAISDLNFKRQREEFGASLTKARLPVCF